MEIYGLSNWEFLLVFGKKKAYNRGWVAEINKHSIQDEIDF